MAQILPMPSFKAPAQSVGHFIRVGETGHRQLADLHAEGRFSPRRAVFDALLSERTRLRRSGRGDHEFYARYSGQIHRRA
jgi:hypothetical protein